MKITKSRKVYISPECISDVGEEDAVFVRKKVLLLRVLCQVEFQLLHQLVVFIQHLFKGNGLLGKNFLLI